MKKLVCPNCPDQHRFIAGTLERHAIIVDSRDEFIEDTGAELVERTSDPTCERCGERAKSVDDGAKLAGQLEVRVMIAKLKCENYPPGAIVTELLKNFRLADLTELLLFAVQNSIDLPSPQLAPDPVGEVGVTGPEGPEL